MHVHRFVHIRVVESRGPRKEGTGREEAGGRSAVGVKRIAPEPHRVAPSRPELRLATPTALRPLLPTHRVMGDTARAQGKVTLREHGTGGRRSGDGLGDGSGDGQGLPQGNSYVTQAAACWRGICIEMTVGRRMDGEVSWMDFARSV